MMGKLKKDLWRPWCSSNTILCGRIITGANPVGLPAKKNASMYDIEAFFLAYFKIFFPLVLLLRLFLCRFLKPLN